MIKVFIPKNEIKDLWYIPVLYPNFGALTNEKRLFSDLGRQSIKSTVVDVVTDVGEADFILLPYEYFDVIKKYPTYLDDALAIARQHNKKLLIFDTSDYTDIKIVLPDAWVFRLAEYASSKYADNIIVMPAFIEDLGINNCVPTLREKAKIPIIGFCGWAEFPTFMQRVKFFIKTVLFNFTALLARGEHNMARRKGLYFRIKAISVFKKSNIVKTNFFIRKNYSSHINTIEKSPEELRREYIDNITDSDVTLSIRGDANYSCRFYEVLSLGRIPLFVNTDCVLPLEDEIDYKKFVVCADYTDIGRLDEIVREFWARTSDEEFVAMQKSAREYFEKYLRADSFFAYIFPKLLKKSKNGKA